MACESRFLGNRRLPDRKEPGQPEQSPDIAATYPKIGTEHGLG